MVTMSEPTYASEEEIVAIIEKTEFYRMANYYGRPQGVKDLAKLLLGKVPATKEASKPMGYKCEYCAEPTPPVNEIELPDKLNMPKWVEGYFDNENLDYRNICSNLYRDTLRLENRVNEIIAYLRRCK